jgi:cytochrome P450
MAADPIPDFPLARLKALDPPAELAALRESCPVVQVRLPSGDLAQLVTRYEESRAVMLDQRRFVRPGPGAEGAKLSTNPDGGLFARASTTVDFAGDGPGHQRWRRLLNRSFTVRKMELWRPRIQQMTDELVNAMLEKGSPANVRDQLGLPLPVRVICALVGSPSEDQDKLSHWAAVMLTVTRYGQEEVDQARMEFGAYVWNLIDRKRADPGDDLLSELIAISDADDGQLSQLELTVTVMALLQAGHETTANMISIMTAMLLAERERFEAVLADPGLVAATVEEVLRFDSLLGPIGVPRVAAEDAEVGGVAVPAGATLIPNKPFANRDPRKFADPDRFDPLRENNAEHLTFGAGPHFCLGQPLARMELQVVLDTLARRLPTLRLRDSPDDLRIRTGGFVGGLEEVWITW